MSLFVHISLFCQSLSVCCMRVLDDTVTKGSFVGVFSCVWSVGFVYVRTGPLRRFLFSGIQVSFVGHFLVFCMEVLADTMASVHLGHALYIWDTGHVWFIYMWHVVFIWDMPYSHGTCRILIEGTCIIHLGHAVFIWDMPYSYRRDNGHVVFIYMWHTWDMPYSYICDSGRALSIYVRLALSICMWHCLGHALLIRYMCHGRIHMWQTCRMHMACATLTNSYVTCLIHVCHDSCICVTWLRHAWQASFMCDVPYSYGIRDTDGYICGMPHSCLSYITRDTDEFIYGTPHSCLTYVYMWHWRICLFLRALFMFDICIYVTLTNSYILACLIHVWHDSCTRVTRLIHMISSIVMSRVCNTLQHTATHCNTLHALQHSAHTATHCNTVHTLQHTATHSTHCNTLQHSAHTATHCNTSQHTDIM